MDVTALDAAFGAEVRGWDPTSALGADESAGLRAALAEHRVLVFRGHATPTDAELIRLGESFGELASTADKYGIETSDGKMLLVSNELDDAGHERGAAGSGAIPWHSDYTFWERGAKESLLEAVRLPPGGGPTTCFCDMYDAYETLPSELRERVDGLTAIHTLWAASNYATAVDPDERAARERQANPDLRYPDDGSGTPHPAVFAHPETGRRSLYVSSFVRGFEGLDDVEGRALLDELLTHADRPERVYCHQWQVGDLVVFDTVGTVHSRGPVPANAGRSMRQLSTLVPA